MSPLTRQELDAMRCECCGEGGDLHLTAKCHPQGALEASYTQGILTVTCAACRKLIVTLRIATGTAQCVQ